MSLSIYWREAPTYPALIKGPAVGIVDGRLLVSGGMAYPWRETEYGFATLITEEPQTVRSLVLPDTETDARPGAWEPMPPLPIGPGWTSGAAVAGGLAVVGGRRKAVGNRATAEVWFLDVAAGAVTWERLPDRPSPAMVATTFAHGDWLYTAFGTDWLPHEHATGDLNVYRMNVRQRSDWEIAAVFPGAPRWMCGMGICGHTLYVIGGHDQPIGGVTTQEPGHAYEWLHGRSREERPNFVVFRDVWACDLDTGTWRELDRPPRAFVADAFTVADRWLVLTGGQTWVVYPDGAAVHIMGHVPDRGFVCHSHEVWALDTVTGSWSLLDPLPYGIASHRVACWEDQVYLVGNETRDALRSNTYGTVFAGRIAIARG